MFPKLCFPGKSLDYPSLDRRLFPTFDTYTLKAPCLPDQAFGNRIITGQMLPVQVEMHWLKSRAFCLSGSDLGMQRVTF